MDDAEQVALQGVKLSEAEAAGLEDRLKKNPEDLEARLKLLGYLTGPSFRNPALSLRRSEHALWFIEHAPENGIVGTPFCILFTFDPGYEKARESWARALVSADARPDILLNAARYFTLSDPDLSKDLLERGERVAPERPVWAEQLGNDLKRKVDVAGQMEARGRTSEGSDVLKETALRALAHFERALALKPEVNERLSLLVKCAEAALEGGRRFDAVFYAEQAIAAAAECRENRHRLDYFHAAHIVLGRVLLNTGDVAGACRELDVAGQQGGYDAPVLRSFGPDFRLASLLLRRGERAAVLSYLDRCAGFWKPKRVAKWRADIERGGTPLMFTGYDPSEKT